VRIAFFGLPLAALLLLEDGHDVAFAAISRTDAVGLPRLRRRLGPDRIFVRSAAPVSRAPTTAGPDDGLYELLGRRLRDDPVDLVVSWFWTVKLAPSLVEAARMGGIGVHPSLLPRHRGPDPYFAAIDQGDPITGVTVHRIADEYDTGPILASEPLVVDPTWNAWQLARKLDRPSLRLLRQTVRRFAAGEPVVEVAQDEQVASWAASPSPQDCALTWAWSNERLLRRIRALSPAPGAFTEVHGRIVTVLRAEATDRFPKALEPGEAAVVDEAAVVRTGDGAIRLVEGECEGIHLDQRRLSRFVASPRELMLG
jgi:methionyl-tRNA formyltransferase